MSAALAPLAGGRRARAIPWAIAALTALAFSPALWNGFVDWDDQVNLLGNLGYRGLGTTQLAWMFTTTLMGHYIPVTWLSFGLDYVIWGMDPVGYHLTSILLHAANAAVCFLVARRLLQRARPAAPPGAQRAGAALAALFFALHPLRAESVAWATERRDVLSGLFFLLAVLAYVRGADAAEPPPRRWLAAALACFVVGLLAKSIVMTLPLVLLVLDAYPLRRLGGAAGWTGRTARRVWREKLPFVLVAGIGAELAWWAVARSGFFRPAESYSLAERLAVAAYGAAFYLVKTVMPTGLSPLYEMPARLQPFEPRFLGSAVLVAAITLGLWLARGRWPGGLAAWIAYLVLLAPVSGFVHSGYQLAHDRYSYLSCLPFALLVGGIPPWLERARASGRVRPGLVPAGVVALLVGLVIALATLTWQQVQVWQSSASLWAHAVDVDPRCAICHDELGAALMNQGQAAAAIPHFERVLDLRPGMTRAEGAIGLALLRSGRPADAETRLRRALVAHPDSVPYLYQLGVALLAQRRFGEAELALRRAIAMLPDAAEPRLALAETYLALGERAQAREQYEAARRLSPALAARLAAAFAAGP